MDRKRWWNVPKVPQTHKDRRRAQLLESAFEVFLRLGYRDARMQDVIDEAGVSRGSLYDYYSSKRDLFAAVLTQRDDASLERLRALASGEQPVAPYVLSWTRTDDVPDDRAARWVRAMVEYELAESESPAHRERAGQRFNAYLSALTAVLEAGVQLGEFDPALPCQAIARFLLVAQDGAAMGRMTMGEAFREGDEYGAALRHFVLTSLGVRSRTVGRSRAESKHRTK